MVSLSLLLHCLFTEEKEASILGQGASNGAVDSVVLSNRRRSQILNLGVS